MRKNKNAVATGAGTIIGAGTVVTGNIKSQAAMMRVDGCINGDIEAEGDVIIGNSGEVKGNIFSNNLIVGGKITGNVKINNKLDIEAEGVLMGDISTKLLSMDEKAVITGQVSMVDVTPTVKEADAEADENKEGDSGETDKKDTDI